ANANGGNGGAANVTANPTARSGDSGLSWSQSSATNTGNTGPATSTAESNPFAISGNSGASGATGPATVNLNAVNTGLLGEAEAGGDFTGAFSGDSGDTGEAGDASAFGTANSLANAGAL